MATKLSSDLVVANGRTARYPWDEWLDGSHWLLRRGEDFDLSPVNFRCMAYGRAGDRGLKVSVVVSGDEVHLQARPGREPLNN